MVGNGLSSSLSNSPEMLGMAVDAGGRNGFVDELNLLGLHDMNGVFSSFGSSFGTIKAAGNQIDFSAVNRLVKILAFLNETFNGQGFRR